MKIDSHIHLWQYDPKSYNWITEDLSAIRNSYTPEDLLPVYKELEIDGCVAVQARQEEAENEALLVYAEKFEHVKGVVGWLDLKADDVQGKIENLVQNKNLKGLREILQGSPKGTMLHPDFIKGVRLLKDYDLCYDLLIFENQLAEANQFMNSIHDDQKVILDHIAKPRIRQQEIHDWKIGIKFLAAHENLYCKVSGMVTEAAWKNWKYEDFIPYLDVVFEAFGPDRLLYGSDWPVSLLSCEYPKVYAILDQYLKPHGTDYYDKVMGMNAKAFYNI